MTEQEAVERLQRGDIGGLKFRVRQYQVRAGRKTGVSRGQAYRRMSGRNSP